MIESPVVLQLVVWNDGETQGIWRATCTISYFLELIDPTQSVAISHYSVVANILQTASMNRVYDPTVPPESRRFVAGSISMNGRARSSGCFPDVVANA